MKSVILTAVRIPITISLQLNDDPITLTAGKSDLNKQPFLATITLANAVSDGCVGGTETITDENNKPVGPLRVFIPEKVMGSRIGELAGKSCFAAEGLDTHDDAVDVGQFVDAYMERMKWSEVYPVRAAGFFDKTKNEDLLAKIIERARGGELGFSYDLKEVQGHLDNEMVKGEIIFVIDDFKWRGATVLRRECAAYYYTDLAAKRIAKIAAQTALSGAKPSDNLPTGTSTHSTPSGQPAGEIEMTPQELAAAITEAQKPLLVEIGKVVAKQGEMETRFTTLEASVKKPAEKTPAQIEAERLAAEAAAKPAGTGVSLADLTTAMTAAVKAGLNDVGLNKFEPGKGKQTTLSAADLASVKRYVPEANETDSENAIDGLNAAIATANSSLKGDELRATLQPLVTLKKRLQRGLMEVA